LREGVLKRQILSAQRSRCDRFHIERPPFAVCEQSSAAAMLVCEKLTPVGFRTRSRWSESRRAVVRLISTLNSVQEKLGNSPCSEVLPQR
jgi:hypothetical protein